MVEQTGLRIRARPGFVDMLTLIEELIILIIDIENTRGVYIPDRAKRYSLAGAVLMELALENRIDTDMESLYVTDSTPLGDNLIDPTLDAIVGEVANSETYPARFWVRRIAEQSDGLREAAESRLVAAGILEADDAGMLSLSRLITRTRRYPSSLGLAGNAGQEIQTRLLQVLYSDVIPDPRDSVIISLAHSCDIFREMLDADAYEGVRERIDLIAGLELLGRSVTGAINELTVAESQVEMRIIRARGGGWPMASGRLPVAGHAFRMAGDIRAFLTEQYLRWGPVFEVKAFGRSFVVMAGVEANLFMTREGRAHLRSYEMFSGFSSALGAGRVLTGMDGADHQRLRRAKRDGYSRARALDALPEALAIVESEMSRLPLGKPLEGFRTMQRILMEQIAVITAETSLYEHLEDTVHFVETMIGVYLARRKPKFLMWTPRMKRARQRLEDLYERVLASHEPEMRVGVDRDLVDDLLELRRSAPDFMPDTDLFANVMGPFFVGTDTVTGTSAFMLYALLDDPLLMEKVRAEADRLFANGQPDAEGLKNMVVTHNAVLETLRMYPIVPALGRRAINSFDFAGYRIPAGTDLLMGIAVPHFLPELFPDPERFDIDRYSPERREHRQPGAFAPFGLGHHTCLGQGFAQVQMLITIAAMAHRLEIGFASPGYRLKMDYSPVPRPARSFKFKILRRRDAEQSNE